MKYFFSLFLSALVALTPVHAQSPIPSKSLTIGPPTNDNKELRFNRNAANKPRVRWNESSSKLQFTNDGTNFKDLGSGAGGGGGGTNLLEERNFDFEIFSAGNFQDWTASGGAVAQDTATELFGDSSATWDASASAQTFSSAAVTIVRGMIGRKCSGEIYYQYSSGASDDYRIQAVLNGSTVVAEAAIATTSGTNVGLALTPGFDCPTTATDTLTLRIIANVSNPGLIELDNAFIGSDRNSVQASQAYLVGQAFIEATAGCNWATSSVSVVAFTAVTACPGPTVVTNPGPGTILTTDSDLPRITINNLPPGRYEVEAKFQGNTSAGASTYALNDGTTTVGNVGGSNGGSNQFSNEVIGVFTYTSAGNRTFEIYGANSAGTTNLLNAPASGGGRVVFTVKRYPLQTVESITYDTLAQSWSGFHADNCAWTRAAATFASPAGDSTCTFSEITNVNFGTVASQSDGNNQPGIVFTPRTAGSYLVCASFSGTTSAGFGKYQLVDGSTVIDDVYGAAALMSYKLCGIVTANSLSSKTVSIQMAVSSGSMNLQETGGTTSPVTRAISWSVVNISQALPSPVFTDIQNLNGSWSANAPLTFNAETSGSFVKGTTTTDFIRSRRSGKDEIIQFQYVQTAAGTNGTGAILITVPNGLSVDTSITGTCNAANPANAQDSDYLKVPSNFGANLGAGTNIAVGGACCMHSTTQFKCSALFGGSTVAFWGSGLGGLTNANTRVGGWLRVPIQGR